jgi:hypothetical protein
MTKLSNSDIQTVERHIVDWMRGRCHEYTAGEIATNVKFFACATLEKIDTEKIMQSVKECSQLMVAGKRRCNFSGEISKTFRLKPSHKPKPETELMSAQLLRIGELAVIEDVNYRGAVIARTYNGFVCLWSPDEFYPAFQTTWSHKLELQVRKLHDDERVTLSKLSSTFENKEQNDGK